jgi:hypothetical protein
VNDFKDNRVSCAGFLPAKQHGQATKLTGRKSIGWPGG